MNREERKEEAAEMCAQHNCSEKLAKIHFDQFVNRDWHPHPPQDFVDWWKWHSDGGGNGGIRRHIAWNVQRYRDEYMEAKKYGVISPS